MPGMTRDEAAALSREVSATVGFRGALQRLAGGSPEGPSWALRVTSMLTGGSGLVRSREVWEHYHERTQQEVRAMVDAMSKDGTLLGALPRGVVRDPDPPPAGETESAPRGRLDSEVSVARWRELTGEAIAQAERDAERALRQSQALRLQSRARRKEAEQLRRALALVPGQASLQGAPVPAAGVRGRVMEWAGAHGGELAVGACAEGTGLSVRAGERRGLAGVPGGPAGAGGQRALPALGRRARRSPSRGTGMSSNRFPGYRPLYPDGDSEEPQATPARDRQTAFERGVLLALIGTAGQCVNRMEQLKEGGRWIIADSDMSDLRRILDRMHHSVLRAERIQQHDE